LAKFRSSTTSAQVCFYNTANALSLGKPVLNVLKLTLNFWTDSFQQKSASICVGMRISKTFLGFGQMSSIMKYTETLWTEKTIWFLSEKMVFLAHTFC